jgi:aerobic carbon-monoxide dehydrogenase medium subunit
VKAPHFKYVRAGSVDEVLDLLAEHGEEAKVIAGGQSLVPTMNMRFAQPELLVDINHLNQLSGIELSGGRLRIGAMTRHAAIVDSRTVAEHAPLLALAGPYIAHEAIRNRGTLGGSLVTADPASEWPACCVALDARIQLRSLRGERWVAAEEFFQGVYETVIEPDELLAAVEFPTIGKCTYAAFSELARRKGDYATVGLAAQGKVKRAGLLGRGEARFRGLRLSFFGVADRPLLARAVAAALEDQALTEATLKSAQAVLTEDLQTMDDLYTCAATKIHMARVLLGRVVTALYRGEMQ